MSGHLYWKKETDASIPQNKIPSHQVPKASSKEIYKISLHLPQKTG
jgi:hypothetical protein